MSKEAPVAEVPAANSPKVRTAAEYRAARMIGVTLHKGGGPCREPEASKWRPPYPAALRPRPAGRAVSHGVDSPLHKTMNPREGS